MPKKLNRKCNRSVKRKRNVVKIAPDNKTTKLTDVTDFCFAHIFQFLDVVDMLNIIDTSKRFNNAAKLAFSSKYRDEKWILSKLRPSSERERRQIYKSFQYLLGLQTDFKFLRSFGDSILKLGVNFGSSQQKYRNKILCYANKYCADQITFFSITFASFKTIHFNKPYTEAEKVFICVAYSGQKDQFNEKVSQYEKIISSPKQSDRWDVHRNAFYEIG